MRVISHRRGARFSGWVLLLVFLAALLLVTGWFVARTGGARDLLAKRISERLGETVTIEDSRIGWPYVLVLRNIQTSGFEAPGTPGVSIGEFRLGFRHFKWRAELRQVYLRVMSEGGGWRPGFAARLADLKQASAHDLVRVSEKVRQRVWLQITGSTLSWLDADGRETASLRDVHFRMEPVRLPEQVVTYYGLRVYVATGGAFGNARELHWEWLTTDNADYIELTRAARYAPGFDSPVDGSEQD